MKESHPSASSNISSDAKSSSFRKNIADSWLDDEGQTAAVMASPPNSNSNNEERDGQPPPPQHEGLSDAAWEKQRERRAVVAGVAGGVAGLMLLGPFSGVAVGVAGALISKRMNNKKEELTFENAKNETELASLLSPKPEI